MKNLLKISQQTFWQILGKVVTSISTFIILAIVARNYGEEGTGLFTLITTYLGIFYLFADFGFNAYVLTKLKKDEDLQNHWSKLLGIRIIWACILTILAIGLFPLWPFSTPVLFAAVLFGILDILSSAIFVSCNLIFQAKLRYDLTLVATLIGRSLGLVIFLIFALFKAPIPLLVFSYLLGGTIIAWSSTLLIKRLNIKLKVYFDFSYMKSLFFNSWPIAATLALNVIYFRIDTFILSYFRTNAEVGVYNIAYSIFQSALVLPTFIMNAYYPIMLKSFAQVKLIGLGLLIMALFGTLLTILLSSLVITVLTGGGFEGSDRSLRILSLGFPAYFLSSLLMWMMVAKGVYKRMLLIYGMGLILNVSLNLSYIPQYSYIASSWITVISEYLILVMQLVVLLLSHKGYSFRLRPTPIQPEETP